jgi:hypothetical protein
MWFGPSERNILCPQRERCIDVCVCVTLFKAELNLHEVEVLRGCFSVCLGLL